MVWQHEILIFLVLLNNTNRIARQGYPDLVKKREGAEIEVENELVTRSTPSRF